MSWCGLLIFTAAGAVVTCIAILLMLALAEPDDRYLADEDGVHDWL